MPDATVVRAGDFDVEDKYEEFATLTVSAPVSAQQALAIEGVIRVPDSQQPTGLVYVEFFQQRPGIPKLITQTGQQLVTADKSPDGDIHYRIELLAPPDLGKHQVEIQLLYPFPKQIPVARGEINVN